ncbi:glycosyltransferase [Cohnella lupini]|uniref:glycosyltransferase n=1 Tax=Cohnella lupini TaxID=1294267 RepID=UPI0011C05439|nr:glycosyltransferase [Cohnella lupini]
MKILFLSWAYPKGNTPYLGIWAHQQALALTALGAEVEVVSTVPFIPKVAGRISAKIKKYSQIPKRETLDGVTVYHPKFLRAVPGSMLDRLLFQVTGWQSRMVISNLEKALEIREFQVIHAHNLFPDGATAYLLSQKYGIPYVITLHDVDKYNSIADKGMLKALSRHILGHAKKVFGVSSRVKNHILSQVPEQRIDLLYNTFWTDNDHGRKTGKSKKIVTIASLIERKGIEYLIRAFHKVALCDEEYELVVIGNGYEWDKLTRLAARLGLQSRVKFEGILSHLEAMEQLSDASIFCLPSWDEAFGVVYAEAMSYGIPVIGCKGEGIGDLVSHRSNGMLVEPRSVEELADALSYLMINAAEAERIGERGRESIKELRPGLFGERLLKQYREILSIG